MGNELADAIIDHIAEADPDLAKEIREAGGITAFREGETLRVELPHSEAELIALHQHHAVERLHEGFRAAAEGMGVPWRCVELSADGTPHEKPLIV